MVQYVPRRRKMPGLNWRSGLQSAAALAGKYVGGRIGSYLSGSKSVESSVVSTQHDVANRYRKKRMPKRRRRQWVGFVKKVRAVELAAQPLQFYGYARLDRTTGAVNVQTYRGYMIGGTTVTNNDELYQIFQQAYNTVSIADAVEHIIYMKSISLDVQVTNTGSAGAVIDVYKLLCRKTFGSASTPDAQFTAALGELAAPSGGGSVTTTNAAITAFDAPNFCSYWKILNKKEILLGAGQVTTMQLRNARNKRIDGKLLTSSPQAVPGYTMCYLFMIRGVPENNAGTGRLASTDITFAAQYNLKYAIPPGKTAEAGRT
jgi:hypothetical protein